MRSNCGNTSPLLSASGSLKCATCGATIPMDVESDMARLYYGFKQRLYWRLMGITKNIANHPIESYQGHEPEIGERVFVHSSATVIGEVQLSDDVSIWPGVVIRGDVNHIKIGVGSNIQDLSI